MATKTLKTTIIMRNDTAENWSTKKPILAKGEFGVENDANKFKIGDGVTAWDELGYACADETQINSLIAAAEDNFTEVVPNDGETDAQAIARVITAPSKGDITVVKRTFGGDKQSYTGYVYNGTAWGAMDGNYNAENVYFNEDLTYTKQIGELPAVGSTGSATLPAAGKNVKEVLASILAKKAQPTVTQPSVSLGGTQTGQNLEVGTAVSKIGTMTSTLNAGSYTYGPATGITAKTWATSVKYSGGENIATGDTASTPYSYNFTLGETAVTVNFSATATYDAGATPKDNLGGTATVAGIAAGSNGKTVAATYTPFRNFFYGVDNGTDPIDSALIRSLTKGGAAAKKTLGTIAASSKTGATRVIVAIPNDSAINVTKVLMPSAMNADATASFVKQPSTVNVAGANGTDFMKAYKVWVYQPASIDSTETYTITLG